MRRRFTGRRKAEIKKGAVAVMAMLVITEYEL
jgi:hypothetical protein